MSIFSTFSNAFSSVFAKPATPPSDDQLTHLTIAVVHSESSPSNITSDYVITFPPSSSFLNYPYTLSTTYYSFHSMKEIEQEPLVDLGNNIHISFNLPLTPTSFLFLPFETNPKSPCEEQNALFNDIDLFIKNEYTCPIEEAIQQYTEKVIEKYQRCIQLSQSNEENPIKDIPLSLLFQQLQTMTGLSIKKDVFENIINKEGMLRISDCIVTGKFMNLTINDTHYDGELLMKMWLLQEFNVINLSNSFAIIARSNTKLKCVETIESTHSLITFEI
ncbi:Uncharacterized protein QTN25_006573 [Entamoeba marina]